MGYFIRTCSSKPCPLDDARPRLILPAGPATRPVVCVIGHATLAGPPERPILEETMSSPASNSVVLRQVLDRARISTVSGLLGVVVASYLDVAADVV